MASQWIQKLVLVIVVLVIEMIGIKNSNPITFFLICLKNFLIPISCLYCFKYFNIQLISGWKS